MTTTEADAMSIVEYLTPAELKLRLESPAEIAVIDVSAEGEFGLGHLLRAVNVPYSRLELLIRPLVPRNACLIVLVDSSNDVTERAAKRLFAVGYERIAILEGGTRAWSQAGFELFRGVYVPSKAFGEWVEHAFDTPSIDAHALSLLLAKGKDVAVLDPRTVAEHAARHIPSSIACPGAELLYRFQDLVPSPDTLVVVACGGRTRGIMGAQSLITAGVPNRVVALADGIHGWTLAGFPMEEGVEHQYGAASTHGASWARERADALVRRFQLPTVDRQALMQWQVADDRTTYIFDVRAPEEYSADHLPGARNAPGGQLIQATDQWVGTHGARIVLVDDDGVRAVMAAYWLTLMGWEAYVLRDDGVNASSRAPGKVAPVAPRRLAADAAAQVIRDACPAPVRAEEIDPAAAALLLEDGALALSVDNSADYLGGHPPGALWAHRARLQRVADLLERGRDVLMFSADGESAHLAAGDLSEMFGSRARSIRVVRGGLAAWTAAGLPVESAPADRLGQQERIDTLFWAQDRRQGNAEAMRAYLEWEKNLLNQIAADGFQFGARTERSTASQVTNE